jgi:SAM-dependent methyltransferase
MLFGTREEFDYVECVDCGCVQRVFNDDAAGDLAAAYPREYYTRLQTPRLTRIGGFFGIRGGWTRFRLGAGRLRRFVSGRRYGRMDWFRRTGTGLDDAILDVGCGSGRLLGRMRKEGFRSLVGLDPNLPPEARDLPGLRWIRDELETHSGRYRLVMVHHSFEHMPDPRRALIAMADRVEPGGFVLLRVPRADSWAYRHYGADWCQLDAPRHTHLLTRKSIEILCAAAGLRVAHVEDDSGPFQIWGSELYRRDIALAESETEAFPARLRGRLARLSARKKARTLRQQGLGDQACFYLEKRSV